MKFEIRYSLSPVIIDPNGRRSIATTDAVGEGKSFQCEADDQTHAIAKLNAREESQNDGKRAVVITSISSSE